MLQEKAMIVRLSISRWTARKFDRSVTREVAKNYGTSEESGRFNKKLIAKEALQSIERAANRARTFHYEQTLPWDDFGGRILPSKNFMEYSKGIRGFRIEFENSVKDFLKGYPEYRESAKKRLSKMFNPLDYPSSYEIGRKFGFGTSIEPVPHSDDFRVSLNKKEQSRIEKELTSNIEHRLKAANEDLFRRLSEVVKRFVDSLSDPETVFRSSLVENAEKLVELLPRLNVSDDKDIEKLRKEVSGKLIVHTPEDLRKDKGLRGQAVKDAKAILSKLQGLRK